MYEIIISLSNQELQLLCSKQIKKCYAISTAKKGGGEQMGSLRTPRGQHVIAEKIGANCPLNTVFIGRQPTGEKYSPQLATAYSHRDWILSRILWLRGIEKGLNCGESVDSYQRYIYIHGTPDEEPMGIAQSNGCIRMRNQDIKELFDMVNLNTPVLIKE